MTLPLRHAATYLGSLITEVGECMTEFRSRLNRGHHCRKSGMSQHTDFNEDMTNESTSVACSKVRL